MSAEDPRSALLEGRAFVDLSGWRKIEVTGAEAEAWLNDLVSANVEGLASGASRRSLLLTPTGRVRAEFTVARREGRILLLVQDPSQPEPVDGLLSPYVLSSDVELADRSASLSLFALPGAACPGGVECIVPSVVGPGTDVLVATEVQATVLEPLSSTRIEASEADLDAWRVVVGRPRFGVDALPEDLPHEAGFADAVAFDKGCYLGQEAVAKVRNLGHPRRLVLHLQSEAAVAVGEAVVAGGGEPAGTITSAAQVDGTWRSLARIGWDARDRELRTENGAVLTAVTSAPEPQARMGP